MQDQVEAATARGLPAACLNSTLAKSEQGRVRGCIADGSLRLLYVSPERLDRLSLELQSASVRPRLLVIDEAHCIAEWGHDFRPSYRKLARARYRLGMPQAVALTGSATAEVRTEIAGSLRLQENYALHLGSFDRTNLWFGAVRVNDEAERLRALLELLRSDDAMAIVYAPTRGMTEAIARALCQAGHRAIPYHAGLSKAQRGSALDGFIRDRVDVMVATCAFGMGIDKPNVRLVVHWAPPSTPEAYYQEAGRAGRDGEFARCVLLWRPTDAALHRRQLDVTFPPRRQLEQIWSTGKKPVGVPANVLDAAERLRRELRPERGQVDWRPIAERRRKADARIRAVEEYAREAGCRRARLVGYFGESLVCCSGCDRCGKRTRIPPLPEAVKARLARLHRALGRERTVWGGCPIEPEVLLGLARTPPSSAAGLADTPGVGPVLAQRLGGAIFGALAARHEEVVLDNDPVLSALRSWRARVALDMGVPAYAVLGNSVLESLAHTRPETRAELARIPGIGPRALAKFAETLLTIARTDRQRNA
jgi:ATP-dependent DNA helicase RecQ